MSDNKHLSLDNRLLIEKSLDDSLSFKAIASLLNKDPSTISKEVRKHRSEKRIVSPGRRFNDCLNRSTCDLTSVCDTCSKKKTQRCASCCLCTKVCDYYIEEVCPKLSVPPYVCNGCSERSKCTLSKMFYKASEADLAYRSSLKSSREGFNINEADIRHLNDILVPLVCKQGQSIHHVYIYHSDELMLSEKTLYSLIASGVLAVRNIDLPKKVRFRARKTKKTGYKVDKACLEGRRYEDFVKFTSLHPDMGIVQMDTVEGVKSESCLLTVHFVTSSFMIAYKRDYNDSRSVTEFFDTLYELLGKELFMKMFPVILTDNGSEFSDPKSIEFDKDGNRRTYVFYCHPSSPWEKGPCEVNHELLRKVNPKGKSWNRFTQKDINLMMSHVNSYAREKLNDKSPYLLFTTLFGEESATLLSISCIKPDEINLSQRLIPVK